MDAYLEALETGWGLKVVLWFQSWRTPLLFDAALGLSLTGELLGFVFIWLLIYWCLDARLARRIGVTYFLVAWLNQWFKEWWQRPRPFQVSSDVAWPYGGTSFGLPSGHASLTVTAWGIVALWVKRWWATLAIFGYTLLIVLSRLVLGVHYPQDVIVGSLIGLSCLGLYSRLEPRLTAWLPTVSTSRLLGIVVGIGAVMLLIHPVLFPGAPGHRAEGAAVIGISLGLTGGMVLEVRTVGFRADGRLWRRILRFLLGATVLIALILGFAAGERALGSAPLLGLLSSGVTGLWASYGAPRVFVAIGLAETQE